MASSTLICTLGGQPQIVTFALDYLLARAETIREVFALYVSLPDGRAERALKKLYAEFKDGTYQGRSCQFRARPLRQGDEILSGVRDEAEAEQVRQTVFSLIADLKRANRTLHLCIAGGPRMLSLMALSAAMLHCGHQDKVWHIYTEPDFLEQARDGAMMHDETGQRVQLVQVPLVPWGAYFPNFALIARTPTEALSAQVAWLDQDERQRCQAVWRRLTGRQREVLRAFAQGLKTQEVAAHLHVTAATVHAHKTTIFEECKNAWNLDPAMRLDYHFLREKFQGFLGHSSQDSMA